MKKNFRLLLALCALIVAGSYTSCNKMEKKENNAANSVQLKAISAKFGFKDYPTVEDGMLKFRDNDHYGAYLEFLGQAMNDIDSTDTVNDEHSVLQQIEDGLKFTSLRSIAHTAYERQNAIGFSTKEEACEEHFVSAVDVRSALNSDLNVRIGDEILHYISVQFAVRVGAGSSDLLGEYMKLPSDASLADINNIDIQKTGSVVYELIGEDRIFGTGNTLGNDHPVPLDCDYIKPPIYHFDNRCEEPTTATFTGLLYDQCGNGPAEWHFKINYGHPGTGNIEYKDASLYQGLIQVAPFTHTFPGTGTYIVTIYACENNNFNPANTASITMTVNVTHNQPSLCSSSFNSSGWQYLQFGTNNGQPAFIGGKLTTENYGDQLNPRLKVYANTKFVRLNTDGSFSGFKNKMYTAVSGAVMDVNCNYVMSVSESGYNSNTKNQTVSKETNYNGFWHDFVSSHSLLTSPGHAAATLTITLKPCD